MFRQIDLVTWRGHLAGNMAQQTCQGGYRLIRLVPELHGKQFLDVADWHAAAHHQSAIRFAYDIRRRGLSRVSALAHDLFHQVFHGGDAGYGSMLVDKPRQRMPLMAILAQQFRAILRFWYYETGL